MRYGRQIDIPSSFMDETNTKILAQTDYEKDVGIIFSNSLKFETHINNIFNKATKCLELSIEASHLFIRTCSSNYINV